MSASFAKTMTVRPNKWPSRWGSVASCVLPLALLVCHSSNLRAQTRVLTTAAEVHNLSSDEAARSLPVHLVATVTYVQANRYTLFLADASGSVFALNPPGKVTLHRGDLVDVKGVTGPSFRTIILKPEVQFLGRGTMPVAKSANFKALIAGNRDCDYVSIRGRIRSASLDSDPNGTMAQLEVLVPGGLVQTWLQDDTGIDLKGLLDAEVELSGVAGGRFNARGQLMSTVLDLSDKQELKVLSPPQVRPTDLPWTAIDKVLPTRFVLDQSQRVKVRGTVTFFEPGNSVVVQHDGESLLAATNDIAPIKLGSVVDVVGFADGHGYGPMLADAVIFPTGQSEEIAPRPLSFAEAIGGKFSDILISLRGTVLSELHGDLSDSMVVMVDQHPVSVRLGESHLPDLPVGTEVTLIGICRITPTAGSRGTSQLFRLDVRRSDDLHVVEQPSWWTVAHLLYLLVTLLAVSILITGWALALRRRVSVQAERIRRSMDVECERSRLLEEINSATPLQLLLEDICRSIGALVTDVRCTYKLLDYEYENGVASQEGTTAVSADGRHTTLFESVMTDAAGVPLGVFRVISSVARTLTREERDALAVGASLANLALNQRRLYERLNFHSSHDPLTGLPNRRYSDLRLDQALVEAAETGERVGVVYIDVDHFKTVNDNFGHKTGDLYLQEISLRLGAAVRTRDLLARIGGDEFLLTVPGLGSLEDGMLHQQRLQSCFSEPFLLAGVTIVGSASIGLAVYPNHGTTAEELQRYADMEMYLAKEHGRPAKTLIRPMQESLSERKAS